MLLEITVRQKRETKEENKVIDECVNRQTATWEAEGPSAGSLRNCVEQP